MAGGFDVNRRDFITAAGIGMLAPMLATRSASAAEKGEDNTMTSESLPEINKFTIGSFKLTAIKDGAVTGEKPWETFGTNQQPEVVQKALTASFLPPEKFVNTFTPAVIDTGSELIVVDTGFGAPMREKGAGKLAAGLKAAGYSPDQVTLVILTHLHGDHIGGLMENGAPAFSKARYVTGQTEYDFWTDKAREGTPAEGNHKAVMANVAPLREKMTFLKDGDNVVSGITAMLATGHTPGHMVFHVESDGKQLVLTGDTANHYILSLGNPDWEVRFDMDKKQAAQTRRRVFDMIAADRIPFLGYHMPFPAVGYVEKHEHGFRYIPKTYQLDL